MAHTIKFQSFQRFKFCVKIRTFEFQIFILLTFNIHTSASLEFPLHSLQAPDWDFRFNLFPWFEVPSFELVPVPENCFLQLFRATPLLTWLQPLLAGDKNCISVNGSRHGSSYFRIKNSHVKANSSDESESSAESTFFFVIMEDSTPNRRALGSAC